MVEHLVWDQGVAGSNPVFPILVWGLSSAGRAPALHAGGQRFDPARLHQKSSLKTERNKQRKRQFLFLDARQTNFIGEFDPGSG
ncbi:hypothetical protein BACI71_140002 [Bacillus mycoides]|uniref:Uncharacterized protein n=1 Tax=Bacillus mycoides TaxID=1405 RepID=A0A653US80_BACMY|nr:hypothetical protein BACI71_140002 [Bacillus mycoides]